MFHAKKDRATKADAHLAHLQALTHKPKLQLAKDLFFFADTQDLKYFSAMEQLNLFAKNNNDFEPIKIQNGEYLYVPYFFDRSEADYYYQKLKNYE